MVSYPRRRRRASGRIVAAMASAPERREPVVLDGRPLTIDEVVDVARAGRGAALAPSARTAMQASRAALERRTAGGEALYGINTGFGSLAMRSSSSASPRASCSPCRCCRGSRARAAWPVPAHPTRCIRCRPRWR
ncbi:MAG: aromatic amino acid lyase, partial [Phycisphaerales bacterium]